ncbi:hypothetical protein MRX96_018736 [Rhipicephalus microplus]
MAFDPSTLAYLTPGVKWWREIGDECSSDGYNAIALARVVYTAAVASVSACQLAALDEDHRNAMREYYGLPHTSQVGPTLLEAGETPISLQVTQRTLNHVLQLKNHKAGAAPRLYALPHSSIVEAGE